MATKQRNSSKLPAITLLCAILMIFLSFFSFGLDAGKFYGSFHWAISWNGLLYSFIDLVNFSIPVILLVYCLLFVRKKTRMMIVPIVLSMLGLMLYTVFLIKEGKSDYIGLQWFYVLSYLSLLFSYIHTVKNPGKSKAPLTALSGFIIGLAVLLTLLRQSPFACYDGTNAYIYLSSLVYFIAFITGIAASAYYAENEPVKNHYAKKAVHPYAGSSFGGVPVELYESKRPLVCLFLTMATGGIYSLYWTYSLCRKFRRLNGDSTGCIREFLCLFFVPTYLFYWLCIGSRAISDAAKDRGVEIPDRGISFLVLGSLGLGIIALAWMQSDLNRIAVHLTASLKPNATLGLGGGHIKAGKREPDTRPIAAKG